MRKWYHEEETTLSPDDAQSIINLIKTFYSELKKWLKIGRNIKKTKLKIFARLFDTRSLHREFSVLSCTRRLYNHPKNSQTQVRQGRFISLNIASKPHLVILFLCVCSGQAIPCYVAKLRGLPWRAAASNKWRRFSSFGMPFGSMRCGHSTGSKARYVSGRMPQLDHIRDCNG